MKNMFEPAVRDEVLSRIRSLSPSSVRQWGRMDAPQMLAHCNESMRVATGQVAFERMFIGRVLGPLFKAGYVGDRPIRKNSPTNPRLIVSDPRTFEEERSTLLRLVTEFCDGGEERCTKHPHSFFGPLTTAEWSVTTYKHLDHHLRQFGA